MKFLFLFVKLFDACYSPSYVGPHAREPTYSCKNTSFETNITKWLGKFEPRDYGPRKDQRFVYVFFENERGWVKKWPLHYYAMKGDLVGIDYEIDENKRNPNEKMSDWFDSEPLGWAASLGELKAVVSLIKKGANPNTENLAGNKPLDDAVREGHLSTANFLAEYECRRAGSL